MLSAFVNSLLNGGKRTELTKLGMIDPFWNLNTTIPGKGMTMKEVLVNNKILLCLLDTLLCKSFKFKANAF